MERELVIDQTKPDKSHTLSPKSPGDRKEDPSKKRRRSLLKTRISFNETKLFNFNHFEDNLKPVEKLTSVRDKSFCVSDVNVPAEHQPEAKISNTVS